MNKDKDMMSVEKKIVKVLQDMINMKKIYVFNVWIKIVLSVKIFIVLNANQGIKGWEIYVNKGVKKGI